jgi:hypothetical protein
VTVAVRHDVGVAAAAGARRLFDPGEEHSLDDTVLTSWRALALRGSAACLVCGATAIRGDGETGAARAECAGCGSALE